MHGDAIRGAANSRVIGSGHGTEPIPEHLRPLFWTSAGRFWSEPGVTGPIEVQTPPGCGAGGCPYCGKSPHSGRESGERDPVRLEPDRKMAAAAAGPG